MPKINSSAKKLHVLKWIASTFIFLFLVTLITSIVLAIKLNTVQNLFHESRSLSIRQAEEIRKLQQPITSNEEKTNDTEWDFVFDGIQGDVLDSKDFTLQVPADGFTYLQNNESYGTSAHILNFEPNTERLTSEPPGSYTLKFSYRDEIPTFFETDFGSIEPITYLGRDAILGSETWFGHPLSRAYYFEDTGLEITIQTSDQIGLNAAEELLQNLEWK